ncbi:Potassium channel KAT1 [Durusdinium trenchii]|uniref:Potassium channel KAT1 n=1 Tax=Durusdinium trenchii TaxID=1381693 RepID=A0ABP0HA57_9DINO
MEWSLDASLELKPFLVRPNSTKMQVWDVVLISGLLYTASVTPFEAAFLEVQPFPAPLFWSNLGVDLVFLTDIFITMSLPFVSAETGLWVTSRREIFFNYLRTWLIIDVISVFPFDYIIAAAYGNDSSALRAFRLVKLLKLARIIRGNRIWKRWRDRVGFNLTRLMFFFYVMVILLIAHWSACVLGVIPFVEGTDDSSNNWQAVYLGGVGQDASTASYGTLYLASFYWSVMTITTVGFGDVTPVTDLERVFSTLLMFVGASLNAYLIGTVCGLVAELSQRNTEHRLTMNLVNEFSSQYNFPQELRVRLRKYITYATSVKTTERYQKIINGLSPNLQDEVNLIVNSVWVKQVPFIQLSPPDELDPLVSKLSSKLKLQIFAPFEAVVRRHDVIDKLYIVSKGLVVLHVKSNPMDRDAFEADHGNIIVRISVADTVRSELVRGQCFGHELIYADIKSVYNATTTQFTELQVLSKDALDKVLTEFRGTAKAIQEYVEGRRGLIQPHVDEDDTDYEGDPAKDI